MGSIFESMRKSAKDYLPAGTVVHECDGDSREGLIVPELIAKYGNPRAHMSRIAFVIVWMIGAVAHRRIGYRSMAKNPPDPKKVADDGFFRRLEEYATSLGCSAVGYAEVPGSRIFAGKSVLHSRAIVLAMPMDKNRIEKAPRISAGREVWRIYYRLGMVSNKVARFLRKHGFSAQAGPALGGDTAYPALAQAAGLGWLGLHGLLISPQVGASQRLTAVYVEIENLPTPGENEHRWVEQFCETCRKCVRECPGEAISGKRKILGDGGPRFIDSAKCAKYFANTMGCSVCIKECVFHQGDYGKIKMGWQQRG